MPKVLIVEDSEMFTMLLTRMVTSELRYDFVCATSYAETERILAEGSHEFDVAVLDLTLPDSEKGEIVDLVAEKIPSVIFTGNLSEEMREFVWARNIADYILKENTQVGYLISIIRRLVDNSSIKALVVDDSQAMRDHLARLLRAHRFQVLEAGDGREALDLLARDPDVRLLIADYYMPLMDGVALTKEVRKNFTKEDMAIIGVSSQDDNMIATQFIKNGANDFLYKPFTAEEFYCRITHNVEMLEHIRYRKESALNDFLTGLYNRKYLFEIGKKMFSNAKRGKNRLVVALLDVDKFKDVNDTYGHDAGDMVLVAIAGLLRDQLREADVVARYGGEEFCILLNNPAPGEELHVMEEMRQSIASHEFDIGESTIRVTASFGVCTQLKDSLERMLKEADVLLYKAKREGRDRVMVDKG